MSIFPGNIYGYVPEHTLELMYIEYSKASLLLMNIRPSLLESLAHKLIKFNPCVIFSECI